MTDASGTERREANRSSVLLMRTLVHGDKESVVRLLNLSEGGASVQSNDLPPPGFPVALRRGENSIRGHIAWKRGEEAGLQFESPVTRSEVLRPIPAPRRQAQVQPRRPALRSNMSNEEVLDLQRMARLAGIVIA
ncbi:PilZ domain-containing protein [Sphingomonas piscis]|uniref:PilZ domain-containing protein n=1 Tax=Sphingomonas piscis TaxID=2714943 RepID=A0A6G7YMR3_9SPHN|nr:PilZ domain-containing protein [Sphingomonas piscis]